MKASAALDGLNGTRSIVAIAFLIFYQTAIAANPPTTVAPGNGSSPGMLVSSLTPTFNWNAASGATGYGLYIRDMTASGTPLIYPNSSGTTANPLTGTSFTMPPGYLVNGHSYRWNMTSFTGSTESSSVSVVLYFQTPPAMVAVAAVPPPVVVANPPTINAPGSASSPGIVAGSLTPTFGWSWVNGATGYGLYIRDMTAAGTPLVYPNAGGTTATPIIGFDFGSGPTFPLPAGYLVNGHTYRWNMTSFTGSKESTTASSVLYFQTPPAVITPPPVVIANPPTINAPGSMSSPGIVAGSLTPTFGWNWVSGATGYGLYIRDMTAPGTPLVYPNSSGTTATPIVGFDFGSGPTFPLPAGYLVNGHTYRWNMTSFTGSKESSTASTILYFQTPPAAISAPSVNSPSSGSSAVTAQPTQPEPVAATSPTTPAMPTPAEGQPDFSSRFYTTDNPFWRDGNAPNASALAKANATGGAFSPLAQGNCTWYAYGRMLELGANSAQLEKAVYGNAGDWAGEAQSVFTVGKTPVLHSIAQLVSKTGFSHGHVAIVESINADGTITVSESSYVASSSSPWNFPWRPRTCSPSWFDNYIYVFNVPNPSAATTTGSSLSSGGTVSGVANSAIVSSPQISPAVQSQAKTILAPTTQTVTYVQLKVRAEQSERGVVSGEGTYALGSSQTVTATANQGFAFVRWTEDEKIVSLSASYTFVLDGHHTLVAHFRQNPVNHPFTPNLPANKSKLQ